MMVVFCLLLAPIFSYVRLKAKSVIAAAIIHGSLNATSGIAIMVIKEGNDLLVGKLKVYYMKRLIYFCLSVEV
ncbi:hypothetical protein J7K55_08745 [Candidatus Aerophobetes bacterium]|nr:hypothetical protein [Candidatus Aerophobetes bacterium]